MSTKEVVVEIPREFQDKLLELIVQFEQLTGIPVEQVQFWQGGLPIPMYDKTRRMKMQ